MPSESKGEKAFKMIVAVLIAVVAAISALVAWQAAAASSAAGTADLLGMDAALNREGAYTVQEARAYQHYTAYTSFADNRQLGTLLDNAVNDRYVASTDPGADPLALELVHRREDAFNVAGSNQLFFVTRYLNATGYDRQRELAEGEAEAARWQDLDPAPHFALADQLRAKSTGLVGTLTLLAGALWFYILASALKHPVRYALASIGLVSMLAAVALAVRIEFFL